MLPDIAYNNVDNSKDDVVIIFLHLQQKKKDKTEEKKKKLTNIIIKYWSSIFIYSYSKTSTYFIIYPCSPSPGLLHRGPLRPQHHLLLRQPGTQIYGSTLAVITTQMHTIIPNHSHPPDLLNLWFLL